MDGVTGPVAIRKGPSRASDVADLQIPVFALCRPESLVFEDHMPNAAMEVKGGVNDGKAGVEQDRGRVNVRKSGVRAHQMRLSSQPCAPCEVDQ